MIIAHEYVITTTVHGWTIYAVYAPRAKNLDTPDVKFRARWNHAIREYDTQTAKPPARVKRANHTALLSYNFVPGTNFQKTKSAAK